MLGRNSRCALRAAVAALILSVIVLMQSSCGGGSAQTPAAPTSQSNPQAATAMVQVNIGDSPADRVIAFAMTINSMSLTNTSGGTVNVITAPMPLEIMQLMVTMQPLAMLNIPQGSYTKATMTIGSATVTYMDPITMQAVQKTVSGMTTTVNFNPSVTISGTGPLIMNFDMNMAGSVSIDMSGNITVNPTLTMSLGTFASGTRNPLNGGMQHLFGSVASVSGTSFTMSVMQSSQNLTFMTNSSTRFDNLSGMGMMSGGMLVMVDAVMQSDGTMLAQEVRSLMTTMGGIMAEGLVTGLTGNPATQLTIIAQNGAGTGMMGSYLATGITVNGGSSTPYVIDTDGVDMSGLPFTPKFDGTTVFKGQRVYAVSGQTTMGSGMGGMMTGTLTASEIDLEQQGLSGTVSAYTQNGSRATFTLTLPSDSAFATLTGSTTVIVFQQVGTTLSGPSAVANGATVHVRGLLFLDAGSYKMVAGTITAS